MPGNSIKVMALVAINFSYPALAAGSPTRPAALVEEVAACRLELNPIRRLVCFDSASAKLAAATEAREIVVVDREEIQETRRSLFGFSLPRVALFGARGPKDEAAVKREDISELTTTITRTRELGHDMYEIGLAQGGTWRSTEAWAGRKIPLAGAKITIKRGALGNYFLRIDGGRAVRGLRVG